VNIVRPPECLSTLDYFLVIWDREEGRYVLILRDQRTFDIGEGPEALRYMYRACENEHFAERCLDVAQNFCAAACFPRAHDVIVWADKFLPQKSEAQLVFEAPKLDWPGVMEPVSFPTYVPRNMVF